MAENSIEAASRVVGRPFPPGVSGNPGDRPVGVRTRILEQTEDGKDLVQFAVNVWQGKSPPEFRNARHRREAFLWLSDHSFGRPVQQVQAEAATTDVRSMPPPPFSVEELVAIRDEILARQQKLVEGELAQHPALPVPSDQP